MKKILLPVDFSKAASKACDYAVRWCEKTGAELHLLHVFTAPCADAAHIPSDLIHEIIEETRKNVLAQLKDFASANHCPGVWKPIAHHGIIIADEIKDIARAGHYDLIIMGTRGEHHTSIEKFLGSFSTHTMKEAPCPLILVPLDYDRSELRRIAYATNFEKGDEKFINFLLSLAADLNVEIHIVHVGFKEDNEQALVYFENLKFSHPISEIVILDSTDTIEGLDYYIRSASIDLLAVFKPRRDFWQGLFHSSFSKKIAFHSKIPLLIGK